MRAERNLFGGGKLLERLGGKSVTQRAQQLVSDIRATQTPNTFHDRAAALSHQQNSHFGTRRIVLQSP
jgi:hypothetical protein